MALFSNRNKKIKVQNNYTIEELYEKIKDHEFSAGKPELTKHGFINIITFPALDRNNQVWVMIAGKNKISIQKQEQAGMANMMKNAGLSAATNGWANIGGTFGNNAKKCEEQVAAVAAELEQMGL